MSVYGLLVLFQIVNLFNMFITYGDTFLPTPSSYDELYYEIIRMHQSFDNLYSMGKDLLVLLLPVPCLSGTYQENATKDSLGGCYRNKHITARHGSM